jgi:hypothetical protein
VATIVILEHRLQGAAGLPYLVYALAERWRAAGHRVLVHYGLEDPPPGDIAVNNIELTIVPDAYRALFRRYRKVINGAVTDISKQRFSRDIVAREDDWHGPVIVKTTTNFGGKPEKLLRSIGERLHLPHDDIPGGPVADGYPIYASAKQVPELAWTTPGLLVEKFLPEQDSHGYYLRVWLFFGERETSGRWRASVPIIKGEDLLEREDVPVPDELRARRKELGFDFGKFDYVRHGERFVLLDTNRTPSFTPAIGGRAARLPDQLAAGLESFLD